MDMLPRDFNFFDDALPREQIKQCQHSSCTKYETETAGSLFTCSGCKLTRYCSKECQKGDWKLHKPMCRLYQERRQRDKEAVKEGKRNDTLKLVRGITEPQAWALMKKWTEQYHPVILASALMAIDMDRNPDHVHTHVLSIYLRPKWTEKKIPRTDAEIARAFEYTEAKVTRWAEIGVDVNQYPMLKASFNKRNDVLDKSSAGTVVVYAVLQIRELFGMYRVCPLAGPKLDTPSDPQQWKDLLDLHINLGWPVDWKTTPKKNLT